MNATALAKRVPNLIKHPFSTVKRWQWRMRGLPAQSPMDIAIIKEVLLAGAAQKFRVFEWGTGASTVYYAKFLRAEGRECDWFAVDNSPSWHERVSKRLENAGLASQVHTACFNFPAFWQLPSYSVDNPVPPGQMNDSPAVAEYVDSPIQLGGSFDLIFIDGRYRRRCLLAAKEALSPDGVVILHDAHRNHYHDSLSAYPHVQFLETGYITGRPQKSTMVLCTVQESHLVRKLVQEYVLPD